MTARRLSGDERRAQILEVSRALFARHGYEATTTQAIASAACVTEPVLYRHFAHKADLYLEVLTTALDEPVARWKEIVAHRPEERWLIEIEAAYREALASEAWPAGLQIDALAHCGAPEVRSAVRAHYRTLHDYLRQGIEATQREGVTSAQLDPDIEAWELVADELLDAVDRLVDLVPASQRERRAAARETRLEVGLKKRRGPGL